MLITKSGSNIQAGPLVRILRHGIQPSGRKYPEKFNYFKISKAFIPPRGLFLGQKMEERRARIVACKEVSSCIFENLQIRFEFNSRVGIMVVWG